MIEKSFSELSIHKFKEKWQFQIVSGENDSILIKIPTEKSFSRYLLLDIYSSFIGHLKSVAEKQISNNQPFKKQ
jgi:hypothetical protein